jgi:hypothetical protein
MTAFYRAITLIKRRALHRHTTNQAPGIGIGLYRNICAVSAAQYAQVMNGLFAEL